MTFGAFALIVYLVVFAAIFLMIFVSSSDESNTSRIVGSTIFGVFWPLVLVITVIFLISEALSTGRRHG